MKGGYLFKQLAGMPRHILCDARIPSKVIIPLRQGFGKEVKPIVKINDKVKTGQVIGIDEFSISSPVHATINGIVKDICPIKTSEEDTNAIIIEADGTKK